MEIMDMVVFDFFSIFFFFIIYVSILSLKSLLLSGTLRMLTTVKRGVLRKELTEKLTYKASLYQIKLGLEVIYKDNIL